MYKNIKLIILLFKIRLIRQMTNRESFIYSLGVNLSLFIVQIIFFDILYTNFDVINGWNKYEMIFFIGTYTFISNVGLMFFYFGLQSLPGMIRSGKMDFYLLKPKNPVLLISFSRFDLTSLPMVIISLMIIVYAAIKNGITNIFNYLIFLILIFMMLVIYFELLLIIRCTAFFLIDISGLLNLEWTMTELTMKVPGTFFKGGIRLLLCVLLPYGIIATIPSYVFFNNISHKIIIFSISITFLFSFISYLLWKYCIRHYNSVSS